MPDDSEHRCRRCDTYLNDDGTCSNQHCPSNRETLPAPAKTAPIPVKFPDMAVPDQNAQTDAPSLDCCDFADENNITSVESPQAKGRHPERARSGMRTRVDPNAANEDEDDSNSSTG